MAVSVWPGISSPLRLDGIPDQRRDIGAAEAFELADAGWRGDVDLGEELADHVDADEKEAALLEDGPDALADFAVALGHLALLGPAADMHVGACLAFGRDAVDGADADAVDEDDALVALPHLRQVT